MTMNWLELFPENVKQLLLNLPKDVLEGLEEVRIREDRPLEINTGGKFHFVSRNGELILIQDEAYKPTREDGHRLLDLISNHSLYTMEEELRKGFITIPGGHRIGLTGRTVLSGGKVEHIRDISGFNVRIAKEIKGAADEILPYLLDTKRKRVLHTLIMSPPQHGKTTLVRDLARQISSGFWGRSNIHWPGMKVGIVDERSEIAGCQRGVPGFDVGPRTDVLDGCPKAEGMMMMLRSMSPDVLIVDEIGRPEDAEAVTEALHAGISVIATAHGSSVQDMRGRPGLAGLVDNRMFEMYVVLARNGEGRSFRLQDGGQRTLQTAGGRGQGGDALA
ncbi:stage III sporulation protein AA [Paenibacillus uliginis N3/975]|uniref:Stage III sporulation protein AA n=1 Tax=Paenibacillus uliginis N3/975 TaxID=1313296 RepID=A0A1X7HKE6_9BACL|nr:stage III sporulation protein AA [Paenibacillus uliginis]SMF87672.1 stage III sporulation protein AA [Paenibacillus uliginis N3/975]